MVLKVVDCYQLSIYYTDSDYGELTADTWNYLYSQYGGGPVIPRTSLSQTTIEETRMDVD